MKQLGALSTCMWYIVPIYNNWMYNDDVHIKLVVLTDSALIFHLRFRV